MILSKDFEKTLRKSAISQQRHGSVVVLGAAIPSHPDPPGCGADALHSEPQPAAILVAPAPLRASRHAQADDRTGQLHLASSLDHGGAVVAVVAVVTNKQDDGSSRK